MCTINHILKEYEWENISLISHSLGSILSFAFAAIFPKKVNLVVGIDALKPSVFEPEKFITRIEDNIENFMLADKRNQEMTEPPAYPIEEMVEKMYKGTRGSVTRECASYLLKRNIKHSEKHPGKFYFSRDSRLKYNYGPSFSQKQSIELAKRINMPYLFIKAKNSPYYERKEYHLEVVEVLKENPNFVYQMVDATHHLHLTEPEKISGLISDFILKHKKPESD
jgi:pimeloyl-ACP methyl ester carboxylesterase